jgi:uncharacterized protein (DUF302 family)
MHNRFAFGTTVSLSPVDAIARVTEELQKEGFGVVTEINMQATLKKKIDQDIPPYVILGACNPGLAHRALQADPSIGLLLPCNVVVRQDDAGVVHVEFLDPGAMFTLVDHDGIGAVADEVRARLQRVMAAL